jgi:hypothetical protein
MSWQLIRPNNINCCSITPLADRMSTSSTLLYISKTKKGLIVSMDRNVEKKVLEGLLIG